MAVMQNTTTPICPHNTITASQLGKLPSGNWSHSAKQLQCNRLRPPGSVSTYNSFLGYHNSQCTTRTNTPCSTKFWAILRQINVPLLRLRSAFHGFISFLIWINKVQITCRDVLFETVPFRSVHTMAAGHWNSNRKEHISNQTVGFFANLWLVKVLLWVHEISKWVLGRNSPPDFLPIWRTTFKSDQVSLHSRWQVL